MFSHGDYIMNSHAMYIWVSSKEDAVPFPLHHCLPHVSLPLNGHIHMVDVHPDYTSYIPLNVTTPMFTVTTYL